jgi:hypothetical protein
MKHNRRNHREYEVISENPTTNKGFINNPAKVAKFSLIQEYFKNAVSLKMLAIF